ncbi:dermonecrotic toxin domain-containing protein [Pseudomonas graminis]
MSTSSPHIPPTFDEIKGALHQIGHHLLQAQSPLLPDYRPTAEQAYLERVNATLKLYHQAFLRKSRALYQALHGSDLRSAQGAASVAQLKTSLNAQLLDMDLRDPLGGKPRKSFMTYDAGFTALEKQARLGVRDHLLDPQDSAIVERMTLAPPLRPGLYALRFGYQSETVELAGAFVATEKNSPEVTDLAATEALGRVLLYTPLRGIEPFDSLAELNDRLVQLFNHPTSHSEFVTLLPKRYHALTAAGIWPLTLAPISEKPLFEHVFDAQVAKRTQDIERALSFADNPEQDSATLVDALDCAIAVTPPDFSARLELRAQALLERHLRLTAPDWYRSANEAQRAALADHLGQYNRARQTLLDLLGPMTTPYALARHQWLERLSDELEIDDLLPEHLLVTTSRTMATMGSVDHQRNLIELALRGPHTGDELAGSAFLQKTTLTYYGKTLPEAYQDLTPAWLARQLLTLQPRIDFADLQKQLHAREETRTAVEHMLDRRMNALAYVAVLQGDLSDEDFQLIQRLRERSDPQLSAASLGASGLSLHGAHLQDLWVLRQTDADGEVKRLLLCTPEAPRAQQFQAFTREADCQSHILGWAIEKGFETPGNMANYLITRAPLRFRRTLQTVLEALSFKPDGREYQKIAFSPAASHQDCLRSMADHILRTRVDDYQFSTPGWYCSASVEARRTLVTLNENIENTLGQYNRQEFSELSFPSFTTYLHEQAKLQLNRLLGRPQNDVDPDTVWAYSPAAIIGIWTPAPQTYTQLFRDGYADGIGFLDEKFSRSARFRGPQGIDLSKLTAESVARSVTGVWIGQRYINHVRSVLLDPYDASYDFRRKTTLAITQWQMHSAALESQLQGHIASVDLQWLESSIASMGDRSASKRNTYALHRLMIDGEWVIDTWLFSHADNPVLLYTPQAPDGISFRPARLFNYLLKKQPGMIAYLTERVGVQSRPRVQAFLEDAQRKLPDQLDKTSVSPARYDSTRSVPVVTDLRLALYNMKLQRKIDDVAATTVNRTQMITGILWTCVEWVTAIATAPFPILSLSAGLLLAFKDAMLALHAYNQGDTSAAFEHYLGYLFNSFGALLTDLRPALRGLHPSPKPLRLSSGAAEQSRALQLLKQLEPTRPNPAGMQPVLFEGRSLWAPKTPDAIGRYLLYRLDPDSGRLISTSRLATPTTEGAWRRSGVVGGNPPRYEGIGQTPHPHTDYGLPAEHCVDIEQFLNPQMNAMLSMHADLLAIPVQTHLDNLYLALRPARGAYQEQVMRLATDAQAFFQRFVPLPAVVDTPAIDASSTFTQLLSSQAFTGNKHLVVGAVPGSIASKQVLITHMDTLIDQGFKTLYVEYLPGDVFAKKLDNLNHGKTWKQIKQHLKAIDAAFGLASNAEYSYLSLVRQARAKGMKVKAIDVTTSYDLDSALILGDTPPTTPRGNNLRNFYSHKVIEADSADVPQERWVALVEQSRLGTYNGTPGLADLQEAVALRIEDVAAEQPVGIWLDAPGAIPGDALAKGDYRMTVHTAYKAAEPIVPSPAAPTVVAAHFDEFDIPAPLRDNVARLANQPHGLDSRYVPFQPASLEAYTAFVRARAKLQIAADSFFVDYAAPPRLPMPMISAGPPPEAFLKQIADSPFSGLVIGEGHGHQSSKALLRTQMKAIKDAGYKTLYIEHLFTDLHQAELDIFQRTQRLPDALKARLRQLDVGHMPFYSGPDNYTQVVQAANKYGLRVRALDCTASYHVKGMEDTGESRNKMFSYFASKVIEADQAAQGPHKWIAFVGSAHTNTNRGVPGLAEMQGAVSLHVRDTTPALARSIHVGGAQTVQHRITSQSVVLISDFKLEVAIT